MTGNPAQLYELSARTGRPIATNEPIVRHPWCNESVTSRPGLRTLPHPHPTDRDPILLASDTTTPEWFSLFGVIARRR